MPDLTGGNAIVNVMPSMDGYFRRVRSEIQGNPVEHRIEPTVDRAALDRARAQVERASEKVEDARRKEADAAGRVRTEEAKLEELRNRGTARADQIVAAEERVARAHRQNEAATRDLDRAVSDLTSAQRREVRVQARFDGEDSDREARTWVQRMQGHAESASDAFGRAGARMNGFADSIRNYAFGAAAAVGGLGVQAFNLASDYEQATGAVNSVFGAASGQMIGYAENAAQAVGLAKGEYANMAAVLGSSLKNMGVSQDELAGRTSGLISMGADLAAMFGGTTAEAVEALGSALRGEMDPIERYGIGIKEADIQARMAKDGLGDLEGEAAKMARTQTLLTMITEQAGPAIGTFGRESGTAAGSMQIMKAEVSNAMTELGQVLLPVVADAATKLADLAGWLMENKWAAYALVGAVGAMVTVWALAKLAAFGFAVAQGVTAAASGSAAAAHGLQGIALGAYTIASGIATAATWAFNAALAVLTSPITLIIVAIAALVAAVIYAYNNFEWFRNGVTAVWDWIKNAIGVAWQVIQTIWDQILEGLRILGGVFTWLYENIVLPVWEAIRVAIAIVAVAIMLTWDVLKGALSLLGDFFRWIYETVIKPAWDAVGAVIRWVTDNVINPAFDFIKFGLGLLGSFFQWIWNNIIKPTWDGLGAGIRWVTDNIINPAFDFIKTGLRLLGDFFSWVWNTIIKPVWDAMGSGIKWVVDNVINPVFNFLKDILHKVGEAFDRVTGWIGQIWDRIKGIAAKPVRFVVETVYNKGIVRAWNKVAGWLKLDNLQEAELGELGRYARGTSSLSLLPGYSPGRDNYDFYSPQGHHIKLSGGEAILRPEVARVLGQGQIDTLNAAAMVGGPRAVAKEMELGHFRGGGIVESIVDKINRFFPGMSITSTYRNSNDLHGAGKAVDASNGTDTTPQMQEMARFFHRNYGPMLAELIHWPLNGWQNVDEGRPFDFGAGTNAQHRNHVHIAAHAPLPEPGQPITPIASGGGGGFFGWLRNRVGDAFNAIMNPIGNAIPNFGDSLMGQVPRKAFDKFKTSVHDWLVGKADEEDAKGYGDPGGGNVQRWRPLVEELLGFYGHPLSWTDLTLRRMNQESGGNPRAINNWDINAANGTPSKGLMQVIDPTFRAYRDPAFVNDIWEPRANVAASMRYATARYGSLPAAYNRAGGYDFGGLASGTGFLLKNVVAPERVLSPRQTKAFESLVPVLSSLSRLAGQNPADWQMADRAMELVAQKVENQYVVDPRKNEREVRRAAKRALAGAGVQI